MISLSFTLDIQRTNFAVSARARQLNHRLKNRRTAIVTRRENDTTLHSQIPRSLSPWGDVNGHGASNAPSPSTGFVAVNTNNRQGAGELAPTEDSALSSQFMFSQSSTDNVTIINGTSIKGASPTTRAELMKKFFTTADRQARGYEDPPAAAQVSRPSSSRPRPRASDASGDYNSLVNPSPTTVAIPNTPSSLLPPPKSNHSEKDDGGPHKMEMVARMEELQRGERIMPPCDRCRRLHMDCLKNLTACMGCTKKHAKCSWKDVKEDELQEARSEGHRPREAPTEESSKSNKDLTSAPSSAAPVSVPAPTPTQTAAATPVRAPLTAPESELPREREPYGNLNSNVRRESAPTTGNGPSGSTVGTEPSPRRAMSEIHGSTAPAHRHPHRTDAAPDDDDPDANQRLMQAIWDTVDHHARESGTVPDGKSDVSQERERERELERERDREHKMVKA